VKSNLKKTIEELISRIEESTDAIKDSADSIKNEVLTNLDTDITEDLKTIHTNASKIIKLEAAAKSLREICEDE
jgi:predicted component of type VI protein secretion system